MIMIWIGDNGEMYRIYAAGEPDSVASEFACAMGVVYTDLLKNTCDGAAGKQFKAAIQRLVADESPLWTDEQIRNHPPEGVTVIMEKPRNDGESASGG